MSDKTKNGPVLQTVAFPKRGKGGKGQTFTAMVFGTAKMAEIKDDKDVVIGKKFVSLDYSTVIKGVREAEVLKIVDAAKYDRIEVLMRGYDSMSRSAASGGTNLETVLATRLRADGVRADIKDDKAREIRLNAIARAILADVREFGEDLEETYADKVRRSLKANPEIPVVAAVETIEADDDESEDDTE